MKHFDIETNTWVDDPAKDQDHGTASLGGFCKTCILKLLGHGAAPGDS